MAEIKAALAAFGDKIPHILFHGPSGSGKRTIVREFIDNIYGERASGAAHSERTNQYVMYVDCAFGNKGIKFIRDELKFFAKTHVDVAFKSIVLLNADKLTMDAQSALRRSIELFSHNTRFFMIAENKFALMQPILSRFCEIYVGHENRHKVGVGPDLGRNARLKALLRTHMPLYDLCTKLYELAYSATDVIEAVSLPDEFLLGLDKRDFRNEKVLMLAVLLAQRAEQAE